MSISTLRQLLADKLGNRDAERFHDDHLQNLLDKAYTDEGALEDATREGLQFHPALPSALVDKLLKAFSHSGRSTEALVEAGAAPSKKAKIDNLETWTSYILGDIPDSVSMDKVKDFLTTQVRPIPCSMDVALKLTQSFSEWRGKVEVTGLCIDGYFGTLIDQGFDATGSERMAFGGTETWIGRILYILGSNAPTGPLFLHLQHDRDVSINSDFSSYSDACRPNSYFIVNRRLLLVGEDKAAREGVEAAANDLRRKSISLARSHYGSLSYILAYAASGHKCELYLMSTDGEVISLDVQFNLKHIQDRASLLATVINIYRLLVCMKNQLPALRNLMPNNIWVRRPDEITEVMHIPGKKGHGGRFHKRTEASSYDSLLHALGSSREDNIRLSSLGTVINGLVSCEIQVTRKHIVHKMPAMGPSLQTSPPQTEQEFKSAARCIATALFTLHSSGGAHHDIRAANVCWRDNSQRLEAVVVDLSTSGPVNTHPTIQLKDWTPSALCADAEGQKTPTLNRDGAYTEHSDMRQMGFMLTMLSKGQQWEGNSTAFCRKLESKQLTASQVLAHAYVTHAQV